MEAWIAPLAAFALLGGLPSPVASTDVLPMICQIETWTSANRFGVVKESCKERPEYNDLEHVDDYIFQINCMPKHVPEGALATVNGNNFSTTKSDSEYLMSTSEETELPSTGEKVVTKKYITINRMIGEFNLVNATPFNNGTIWTLHGVGTCSRRRLPAAKL